MAPADSAPGERKGHERSKGWARESGQVQEGRHWRVKGGTQARAEYWGWRGRLRCRGGQGWGGAPGSGSMGADEGSAGRGCWILNVGETIRTAISDAEERRSDRFHRG